MESLKLKKREKLCSPTAVDALFAGAEGTRGTLAYPLRAVWMKRPEGQRPGTDVQFLVSIPKRRLRKAVDRVKMRRRVREAFRLNRHLINVESPVNVAFIYVANELTDYGKVETAMCRLLSRLC